MSNLSDEQIERAIEVALSRYPDAAERVDWDDLLYRIETDLDVDLGSDMLAPAIRQLKRRINQARKEAAQ